MPVQRLPLLAPRQHELDRPLRLARERGGDRLGADEGLRAERAAHRQADDPDRFRRDPEDGREVVAHAERRLRAGPELEPVAVPAGHAGVRLHVRVLRACDPVHALDDRVGLGEARVDVAVADAEPMADVRAGLRAHREIRGRATGGRRLVEQRRAGLRGLDGVEDGRQLLVVDLHERHGLLGLLGRRRGDGGDGIAHVACTLGEHVLVLDLAAVRAEVAHIVRRQDDAAFRNGRGVDTDDPCVRKERTDDARVQHPRQLEVLGVTRRPSRARIAHPAPLGRAPSRTAMTRDLPRSRSRDAAGRAMPGRQSRDVPCVASPVGTCPGTCPGPGPGTWPGEPLARGSLTLRSPPARGAPRPRSRAAGTRMSR